VEQWIQFALLMLAILAVLVRTEHRLTVVEEGLKAEKAVGNYLEKRMDRLERERA